MKKIIFYIELFLIGGRERVIVNIVNGLQALGVKTEIVLDNDVCGWDIVQLSMLTGKSSFLGKSFLIKDIIENNECFISNFDIYNYNNDLGTYANTHEFIGFLYYPEKIISVCHTSKVSFHLSSNKKLSHYLNSNIFAVISICDTIANIIKSEYKLNNTRVIFNSTDLNLIHKKMNDTLDEQINYKYILAVGRLSHEKNFQSLIKAYSQTALKNDNIKLLIIGDGEEKQNLQRTASKLGLKSNIIFLGNKDNPFKYMKNALFMVMSSKYEGFPMVLGECLATGTPVVSYDLQTGPNEIIVHEYNGLLVENQNEQKLTEAIDRLYSDKALYEKCKSNAIESVVKFDNKFIISHWKTLIDEVIQNNNKTYKLKTDEDNYKNPHGEFTNYELLYYINCVLSYKNILEYLQECIKDNISVRDYEVNIYNLVDRYCVVFKCSSYIKNMIEINVASNIITALRNIDLIDIEQNRISNELYRTIEIYDKNHAIVEILMKKNDVCQAIYSDKWYNFSELSKKDKITFMISIITKYIINRVRKSAKPIIKLIGELKIKLGLNI